MASEADSSRSAPSTTQNSTQTRSRGPSAHTTWAHSRSARPGEDSTQKYCIHCTTDPIFKTTVTTNLRNHLKTKHKIIVEGTQSPIQATTIEQLQQLYLQAESLRQTDNIDAQVFRKQLNQDVINEALVSLIVVRNLPFQLVEWSEFHTFCQVLNPESHSAITTAHSQIGKKIDQAWQCHKDTVRKKLQSALSSIHISVDIWTSPNKLLLLAVVADFIDCIEEKHIKALLALPPVKGHSGQMQFTALLPVLQDYGIVRKLGALVADNSGTNDTLCREIEAHLLEEEHLEWDSTHWRLRCLGHIINLAVQAFLFHNSIEMEDLESYDDLEAAGQFQNDDETRKKFRLLGPLGKLHNIIVNIRGSTSRTAEFLDLAGRMIPLDNRTRWNSWFESLLVADKHMSSVDTYTKEHFAELSADYLTPEDWARLRTIKSFLQPFQRATLETQGYRATIDSVLFTMDILVQYFKTALVSILSLVFSSFKEILTLYNSLNMLLTMSFALGLGRGGQFLTSIILKQMIHLYMLLPLFFTQIVAQSISRQIGQQNGLRQS